MQENSGSIMGTSGGEGVGSRTGRRAEDHAVCPIFAQHHVVAGNGKLNDTGKVAGDHDVIQRRQFPQAGAGLVQHLAMQQHAFGNPIVPPFAAVQFHRSDPAP